MRELGDLIRYIFIHFWWLLLIVGAASLLLLASMDHSKEQLSGYEKCKAANGYWLHVKLNEYICIDKNALIELADK